MQQRGRELSEDEGPESIRAVGVEVVQPPPTPKMPPRATPAPRAQETTLAEEPVTEPAEEPAEMPEPAAAEPVEETIYVHTPIVGESQVTSATEIASEPVVEEPAAVFEVASLPASEQELHFHYERG